jgi:hypothetical protein
MADVMHAHRGRIQAQGGKTEQSESWSQNEAPSESEMMTRADLLEGKLTDREKRDRAEPLAKLRSFLRNAARRGGLQAPVSKSWLKRGSRDIRIDLEVLAGRACVPD